MFGFGSVNSFCLHSAHNDTSKAHAHRKRSIQDDILFFQIAGTSGGVSTLQDIDQKIKLALYYRRVYIVNFDNRPHNFGAWLDDTRGKSLRDKDIDPLKLVAAIVKCPRNCQHEVTTSGVHSVSYESQFSSTVGTCQESDPQTKGKIVFIKIKQERDPLFIDYYDYYLVTLQISENWTLTSQYGTQCMQPDTPPIDHTCIIREPLDTRP